jgi:hypothetical protein
MRVIPTGPNPNIPAEEVHRGGGGGKGGKGGKAVQGLAEDETDAILSAKMAHVPRWVQLTPPEEGAEKINPSKEDTSQTDEQKLALGKAALKSGDAEDEVAQIRARWKKVAKWSFITIAVISVAALLAFVLITTFGLFGD